MHVEVGAFAGSSLDGDPEFWIPPQCVEKFPRTDHKTAGKCYLTTVVAKDQHMIVNIDFEHKKTVVGFFRGFFY